MGNTVVLFTIFIVILINICRLCRILLWRPYTITKFFEKQGIKGPQCKFLYGSLNEMKRLKHKSSDLVLDTNSNDIIPTVMPYYHQWSQDYGEMMVYWHGVEPRIIITDPEMAKQILSNKFGVYRRIKVQAAVEKMFGGKGLIFAEGEEWVRHRKILSHAFSLNKLKIMRKKITECAIIMLSEWEKKAVEAENQCIKLEINVEFKKLTSDAIAHSAFGSSYVEAQDAIKAQIELQKLIVASNLDIIIPGWQYIPTPSNFRTWKLDRKVKNKLRSIVETRLRQVKESNCSYGDDLLGVMIESLDITREQKRSSPKLKINEIIENCKGFFFAGHEATTNFLTWAVFILSIHTEWQYKLRQEVMNECGMEIPNSEMLSKLKLVHMVLLEVLRLYNPSIALLRISTKNMKLGNLMIPKGTGVEIPIHKIHRSKEYWGEDADEFNPMRFVDGISKATKHSNAFLPFSAGPRVCIGQSFAMLEAKAVLSLMLQRISWSLAPEYKHAPINFITIRPRYGMPILIQPLSSSRS